MNTEYKYHPDYTLTERRKFRATFSHDSERNPDLGRQDAQLGKWSALTSSLGSTATLEAQKRTAPSISFSTSKRLPLSSPQPSLSSSQYTTPTVTSPNYLFGQRHNAARSYAFSTTAEENLDEALKRKEELADIRRKRDHLRKSLVKAPPQKKNNGEEHSAHVHTRVHSDVCNYIYCRNMYYLPSIQPPLIHSLIHLPIYPLFCTQMYR